MTSISINTLSQRLTKKLQDKGIKGARSHARKLANLMAKKAADWKEEIYKILSTPAKNRGYFRGAKGGGRLKLHNSFSYNNGFPMMVKGLLRNSIYYNVTVRDNKHGASIRINRGFHKLKTGSVAGYSDYGEFLNQEHGTLSGWKQRAYDKLDQRIRLV